MTKRITLVEAIESLNGAAAPTTEDYSLLVAELLWMLLNDPAAVEGISPEVGNVLTLLFAVVPQSTLLELVPITEEAFEQAVADTADKTVDELLEFLKSQSGPND